MSGFFCQVQVSRRICRLSVVSKAPLTPNNQVKCYLRKTNKSAEQCALPALFLATHLYKPSSLPQTSSITSTCQSSSSSNLYLPPSSRGSFSLYHRISGRGSPITRHSNLAVLPDTASTSWSFWVNRGEVPSNSGSISAGRGTRNDSSTSQYSKLNIT